MHGAFLLIHSTGCWCFCAKKQQSTVLQMNSICKKTCNKNHEVFTSGHRCMRNFKTKAQPVPGHNTVTASGRARAATIFGAASSAVQWPFLIQRIPKVCKLLKYLDILGEPVRKMEKHSRISHVPRVTIRISTSCFFTIKCSSLNNKLPIAGAEGVLEIQFSLQIFPVTIWGPSFFWT